MDEAQRQRAVDALGVLDTPPDERVDRVARLAQEMFDVPMVSVTLIDHDRQFRVSEIGLGSREAPRQGAFCDLAIREPDTMVIEDASTVASLADNPFVAGDPHLRFYAGHPLKAPGGEPVGTLCLLDTRPRVLEQRQVDLLRELALWVQSELTHAREREGAASIQRAVLSAPAPTAAGWTFASAARPAGELLGDMHDWDERGDTVRLTLADVMGKGAGPAMIAAGLRGSLRTSPERSVVSAMAEADALLSGVIGETQMFVTAVHADLDLHTGTLDLVDAGHSLAFILRSDDSWEAVRSTGLPLGTGFLEPRSPVELRLNPGDTFMVCSDGLLDVLDPHDPYGHVLRTLRSLSPAGAVAEALRLARDRDAPDDVTVMVVRRDA